jgi:predicted enzyme related to lactoylglutathione lyase
MQSTVRLDESVSIDAPQAAVWDAIADYSFDECWRGGLTEMTPDPPGPPAVGTRVHEVVKFAGRTFTTDCTVTHVEPGSAYEFTGNGTSGEIRGRRTVRPLTAGGASAFGYEIELTPRRGLRPFARLLGPILRSGLRRDLGRLKSLLENGARNGSPVALVEFPADDSDRARRFWNGLLGVELAARTPDQGAGWQTTTEDPAIGVHERGRGPGDSFSLPYLQVRDMASALARVEELGGSVVHPGESFAICKDSEGSPFGLTARKLA